MQEVIEPIIHNAPVIGLSVNVNTVRLSIGDKADMRQMKDRRIGIFASVTKRRLWLFARETLALSGHFGPDYARILLPVLHQSHHLRVRIVGLQHEPIARAPRFTSRSGATASILCRTSYFSGRTRPPEAR